MNVEDSYEGALRRMQRLQMAGIAIEPPVAAEPDEGSADRMRELEELAVLACDENERLKHDLSVALRDADDARREVDNARGQTVLAQHDLNEARHEIDQLRAYVASLEQALTSAQQASAPCATAPQQLFAAPQQSFEAAPQPEFEAPREAFASPSTFESPNASDGWPEEDYGYPPKSKGKGAFYFCVIAIAGAAVAALCVMRPWDRPHAVPAVVDSPQPAPSPPVVTAPPPAPKVEAPVSHIAPIVPKAPPVVAAPAPRTIKARPERKHANQRAAKKHTSETKRDALPSMSDDPLGGTGL
jgi:hypothetical protein